MSDSAAAAARLHAANRAHALARPGPGGGWQPVHTVYGGAHLFRADTAPRLGERARAAMDAHLPDAAALAHVLGLPAGALAERVYARVRTRLERAPVEDYRIDFEDGYGIRPDEEEDGHALAAAHQVARGVAAGTVPRMMGIRVRALNAATHARAARTLAIFMDALLGDGGVVPERFVVTLPKVAVPEQPAYLAALLDEIERRHRLAPGAIGIELMVETPDALFGADGRAALPDLVRAGEGRVRAAHFGAYDYTAALGITAASQRLTHPACDWARSAMQTQLAGSGVWLVDGATAVLPVPLHREPASDAERAENRDAMLRAWRLHAADVRHGLEAGFHQGWDLHPAQLVTRYGAVYAFFLEELEAAAARLRNFVERAARATRVGTAFDDAATGEGLLNFFRRGVGSGALSGDEAAAALGIPWDRLATGTFASLTRGD